MKRLAFPVALAAGAFALASCGSKPDTTTAPADTTTENAAAGNMAAGEAPAAALAPGQVFANTAAASDAFEIATSNLALQASQSAAIKRFAQQMITAHTESTNKLKAATASATPAITPDATLTSAQQAKLAELQAKRGAEFDAAYAAEQAAAHQMTLDALRSYAASPDVPQLGEFARAMVPTVAAHLNMAKTLSR